MKPIDPAGTVQLHLETVIGIEDTGRDGATTKTDGGHERTEIGEIGAGMGARGKDTDTETETEVGVRGKKGVVEIRIGVREKKTVDLLEVHARRATTATKTDPRKTPEQLWPAEPQDQAPPGPGTGANADTTEGEPVEKEAANFGNTGLLAAATNTINGVVLKYSEPAEARKPPGSQKWRLFVFKDKDIVDNIDLNVNSCWLVGRDRAVADLPVDHPSCSKQHAVIQFRFVTKVGEFGDKESSVKPYLLDLDSANGTFVGKDRIPEKRYFELKEGDLVKFGLSTREYVFMLEKD